MVDWLDDRGADDPNRRVVKVEIQPVYACDSQRPPPVHVYVYLPASPAAPPSVRSVFDRADINPNAARVVGIERQ